MKKEDKDIEIHFENGHVPRRQNQNSNISNTAARGMRRKKKSKDAKEPGKLKRRWKNLKKWQRVVIIVVAVILLLAAVSCALVFGMWGGFKKNVDKDNLGVSDDIANKYGKTDIVNIALFGVDTRDKDSFSGRSDSIMIVSIDKAKNDVKLISVLRDSCVAIDGHGNQKITHAYAYGGAELAIKTLNQNFNMNITDYATINFYKLAEAIDILGGVDIDITEDERLELNNIGDDDNPNFQYVEKSGMVHLTGEQASVYSRIRKRDSDNARVDRQKKVIECLIDKAKNISPTKYADLVKAGMALCETSMSVPEVLSFAPMLSNDITIETMVVPGDEDNAVGGIYDGDTILRRQPTECTCSFTAKFRKQLRRQRKNKSRRQQPRAQNPLRLQQRAAALQTAVQKAKVPPRHRLSTAAAIINPKPRQNRRQPPRQPKTAKLPKSTLRLNPRQRHRPTKLSRQRDKFKQYIF